MRYDTCRSLRGRPFVKAFLLYVDDWLASKHIRQMDPYEEMGYFHLLLAEATEPDCGLPTDQRQLAMLSGLGPQWFKPTRDKNKKIFSMSSGEKILLCFFERDGRLFNERLLREFNYQREVNEKRRLSGFMGGRPRKANANQTVIVEKPFDNQTCNQTHKQNESKTKATQTIPTTTTTTPTSTPSAMATPTSLDISTCIDTIHTARFSARNVYDSEISQNNGSVVRHAVHPKKNSEFDPVFDSWFEDTFWPGYWRKSNKASGKKELSKCATSEEERVRIFASMIAQTPEQKRRDIDRRPHLSTWAHQKRFDDEPELFENGSKVVKDDEILKALNRIMP